MLRGYRNAWNNLDLTISHVDLPPYSGGRDFSAGIRTTSEDGGRSLAFVVLPSVVNDTPRRGWEHEDLGINIMEFYIDWHLDLLLVVEAPADESVVPALAGENS